MQPAFVLRDNNRRTNEPNARLTLLNKNLTTCIVFAQGNLSIGTNDFYAGFYFWKYCIHGFDLINTPGRVRDYA